MLTPNTALQNGRYRIIRSIGQGGMGAVYEAYDNNLSNRVALKEAQVNNDASLLRAFEREAQRLDRLRHVALPTVKDHFTEGGGQYLVMEYIEGQDLREMLKQRKQPFPVQEVLAWADTLLDALTYLHSRKPPLIHRDIKPANLKLTPDGQIILLDFGLAKGGLTRQTLAGGSLYGYTPGYAPAEQMEGEPTDQRSDLYALGATLYALLTARTPDDPISRRKYIERGLPDLLLPANQVNAQVPPHVAQALQQATAIEPALRPDSAAQMRAMLKGTHTPPVGPAPFSSTDTSSNNKLALLLGVVMGAMLLIGVLLVAAYVVRNGANDEPIVIVTEQSVATDATPTQTSAPLPTQEPSLSQPSPAQIVSVLDCAYSDSEFTSPVDQTVELHMIGVYETRSDHGPEYHPMGDANIHLSDLHTPIVLALSSYEPTRWNLSGNTNMITSVIVAGYQKQEVTGIPESKTQIYTEDNGNFIVASAEEWGSSETETFKQFAEEISGYSLSSFRGCYRATKFEIHP